MPYVYNQTSVSSYLAARPYLIKLGMSILWLVFSSCWISTNRIEEAEGHFTKYHIEQTLVGGLLIFAALSIGFSESFGCEKSRHDHWFCICTGMITGSTIGGFISLVIARQVLKLEPGSSSTILVIYPIAFAIGLALSILTRFRPKLATTSLLLLSSVILAHALGGHVDGAFSLLTALLVGIIQQCFLMMANRGLSNMAELLQRGIVAGGLMTAVCVATFFLKVEELRELHGPFILRVLALGHAERPSPTSCLILLMSSFIVILFLIVVSIINEKKQQLPRYSPSPINSSQRALTRSR